MSSSCLNLSSTAEITVIEAYGAGIARIEREGTTLWIRCSEYFEEVQKDDTIVIVGSYAHDGRYSVVAVHNLSLFEGSKGRTVIQVTTLEFGESEIYEGYVSGNAIVYLDRGSRTVFRQGGTQPNYSVDSFGAEREEALIRETLELKSVSIDPTESVSFLFWNTYMTTVMRDLKIGEPTVPTAPAESIDDYPNLIFVPGGSFGGHIHTVESIEIEGETTSPADLERARNMGSAHILTTSRES